MIFSPARIALVVVGCGVLGVGVAMLLAADLGSDGYSTLVNGVAMALGVSFWTANLIIGVVFLLVAASRRVYPGPGTLVQVVVVGLTVSAMLEVLGTPGPLLGQVALLVAAFPVLAVGIATYLGVILAPAPPRQPLWRGTHRCRSAGATAWSRAAERSSAGYLAPPWVQERLRWSCFSALPSTSSAGFYDST